MSTILIYIQFSIFDEIYKNIENIFILIFLFIFVHLFIFYNKTQYQTCALTFYNFINMK